MAAFTLRRSMCTSVSARHQSSNLQACAHRTWLVIVGTVGVSSVACGNTKMVPSYMQRICEVRPT